MTTIHRRLVAGAFAVAAIAFAVGPALARNIEEVGPSRAAALHDCTAIAQRYNDNTWGNLEMYKYRACMAEHGQPE